MRPMKNLRAKAKLGEGQNLTLKVDYFIGNKGAERQGLGLPDSESAFDMLPRICLLIDFNVDQSHGPWKKC